MTESQTRPPRVLMVAAECKPYAWTGGLGDVIGSLPAALRSLGADVRVALPSYGAIDASQQEEISGSNAITLAINNSVYRGDVNLLDPGPFPLYLIRSDDYFTNRPNLYGYPDDGLRFVFFARGVLAALETIGWHPDVIHCHDWHTALIPNLLHAQGAAETPASVMTIHNMEYQGHFGDDILRAAGLESGGFLAHPTDAELTERLVFLARGIHYADALSTVSPTYAREIMTSEYGEKLDPLLRERRDSVVGILNGIDTEALDPASDSDLVQSFSVDNTAPRRLNKASLQQEVGLPVQADTPLIGMVTRLADHKGLDLVARTIPQILEQGAQLVVLGTGDLRHHEMLSRAASDHPSKIAVALRFDSPLAQRIYGSSDMFLMPSRHEPCGLGQLIAMRYGSVPIVRATGGLTDTVIDFDARSGAGTGFAFTQYDPIDLFGAIARALETYKHPEAWQSLIHNGMSRDASWDAAALAYLDLYSHACNRHENARKS